MEQIKNKCERVIAFVIATNAYQGHSSRGERMSICLPKDSVTAVCDLSNIIGRMEVYINKCDKENFDYMEKFFEKTCDKHGIDLDEFEDWLNAEKEMQEANENDNCENCSNG